jgi:biofilm PGA synthesis N-glycosyltransferase PgaC
MDAAFRGAPSGPFLGNRPCIRADLGYVDGRIEQAAMLKPKEGPTADLKYVLITPARNEASYIERTLLSVINQTVGPLKWVIVNDGSTDATAEIVSKHATACPWITLLQRPTRKDRHFGGKAAAFNAGYERVKDLDYDIIGNLDADIAFDDGYFAFLLAKFAHDPRLGVAGTPFQEGAVQYDYRFSRREHVSGACQLFRRECFKSIGGYIPRKEGGIDLVAVVTARMKGWRTETFLDKTCLHLRPMGQAGPHFLRYTFKSGHGDYLMGVHPLWQLFRSAYQMTRKPLVMSGFLLLAGFTWAMMTKPSKPVSIEFVRFRRNEQKKWLSDYYHQVLTLLN